MSRSARGGQIRSQNAKCAANTQKAEREGFEPSMDGTAHTCGKTGGWTCTHKRRTLIAMAETKTQRVHLRVAASDDELFRSAAAATHESLSEFLVESGRERAERVLADRTRFVLSRAQWRSFTAALDRPAREIPAVVELFRRSRPE